MVRRTISDAEQGKPSVREDTIRMITEDAFRWPASAYETVARGAPNPDFPEDARLRAVVDVATNRLPINVADADLATLSEWNELVKTTLEGIRSIRKFLGDDVADFMIKSLAEAAAKRGDHDVVNTLRRIS